MTVKVLSMSIFSKKGVCVYYGNWQGTRLSAQKVAEDQQVMYGMLYSLKLFCDKIAPPGAAPGSTNFQCYRTDKYALHFYESPTGVKFVALTNPEAQDLSSQLAIFYRTVYLDYVVKNPHIVPNSMEPISCQHFDRQTSAFVKKLEIL